MVPVGVHGPILPQTGPTFLFLTTSKRLIISAGSTVDLNQRIEFPLIAALARLQRGHDVGAPTADRKAARLRAAEWKR
jgi:hypothetical protein